MNGARPAGFWIRVAALVIDCVVVALVRLSLRLAALRASRGSLADSTVLDLTVGLFTLAFAALYVTLLHAATGQTIGKMLVGVRVVMVDGERVPLGASLVRFLGYFLSWMPLGFGYLMAGLRRDKRALHDLIADTRVDRAPARAPLVPAEAAPPLS